MKDTWFLYSTLLGSDSRRTATTDAVDSWLSGIIDHPNYQADACVNGEPTPMAVSRISAIACSIKAAPFSDIKIGDMVKCLEETWIVVELYIDSVGFVNGTMWLCNNVLRFQNNSTSVHTRYCVVDDGTYSKKSTDPYAYVMTNTYKVYIALDEDTKKLFVDKRLGFGKIYSSNGEEILEVYKVIGIDVKSKNFGIGSHLMLVTVQRDVYNPLTDSLEDNICDIYTENGDEVSPETTGSCLVAGSDSIRIGTTRQYTVSFNNSNGEEAAGVEAAWNVSVPSGVTYNIHENVCKINVPLEQDIVGEVITISVSDSNGIYGTYDKKVQVITLG